MFLSLLLAFCFLWLWLCKAVESYEWVDRVNKSTSIETLASLFMVPLPNVESTSRKDPRKRKSMSISMPAVLRSWGCDDDLWVRVKSKKRLARFAEEGKEELVRKIIASVRDDLWTRYGNPQVDVVIMNTLASWGCNAELWGKVRPKAKLVRLAREGKEGEARKLIASTRLAIDGVTAFARKQQNISVSMPAKLKAWGCDDDLWMRVRRKKMLAQLAKEGKEEEAREIIASVRDELEGDPQVDAAIMETLASWGCDAELWDKVRPKAKLARLAREGKEERGRDIIGSIRLAIDGADAATLDTLASWGCNAELWKNIRNKARLAAHARNGEEEAARKVIASLRYALHGPDAATLETLASWGCDAEQWEKVTPKMELARLAREGKEGEARETITSTRLAIDGVDAATLETLASWGCDAELWGKVRQKARLVAFALQGKEDKARKVIGRLRLAIDGPDAATLEILASWGCDAELWKKVAYKRKLARLAKEGEEDEARDLIASTRYAIDGIDAVTLERLASWGCDAELWGKVIPKAKLARLAWQGKEEWARKMIRKLRYAIDGPDVATLEKFAKNQTAIEEWFRLAKEGDEGAEDVTLETLASWGCDAELWDKVIPKIKLARLAREGKEEEARETIASIQSAADALETLASWGCDAELWQKVTPKGKLIRLAREGKEDEARAVIASIQYAINGVDAATLETLASWGCDAALWAKVGPKARLAWLARHGDEEAAREIISSI